MLHFTDDSHPGFTRRNFRNGFVYNDTDGKKITDATVIARVNALAIPPAYTSVWICPSATGHLQATGIDARGRKQYRYHPEWSTARNAAKFDRLIAFGTALPRLRHAVRMHLAHPGMSRQKICAAIVALLDKTHIRIGNEIYAEENHSFGLSTLKRRHVTMHGDVITFRFVGKSGVRHTTTLHDRTLSTIIRNCEEIPGHQLFCYIDETNTLHDVTSSHVNQYLKDISGGDYSAKDFRTWHGTVLAATLLTDIQPYIDSERTQNIVTAVREVAKSLGNTPAVCRKCYIHPAVLDTYAAGVPNDLTAIFAKTVRRPVSGLHIPEQHTLRFLEQIA